MESLVTGANLHAMNRDQTPAQVRAFFDGHRTVRQYLTQPDGSPIRMSPEELDAVMHAAQRAPTDATAQLYSFIHLASPEIRAQMAHLTTNAHVATASEAFMVCADTRRVKQLLEAAGHTAGTWPAIAVHFGLGDAVMAGTNLLTAAEMLGYQGCWIGGIMNNLIPIAEALKLPADVLPFAALTLGRSAENTPYRPRVPRPMVFHTDHYRDPTPAELQEALAVMNPIAARPNKPGNWANLLRAYFAQDGGMEHREPHLVELLKRQGMWAGEGKE